jgi:hypothetical protein
VQQADNSVAGDSPVYIDFEFEISPNTAKIGVHAAVRTAASLFLETLQQFRSTERRRTDIVMHATSTETAWQAEYALSSKISR